MNRLIIIGAGGHGKAIADNAIKNGYAEICFLDDQMTGDCMGFPIVGSCKDVEMLNEGDVDFIIGVGNNAVRKRMAEKYNVNWTTLIHPTAQIGMGVSVGRGTAIMAGAVVNACTVIGEHCIINTGAIVEHDNVIGDFSHISPAAALGGTVQIGERTHIGIGAVVRNNVSICGESTVGAGAVVVKDINNSGVFVGVPAKKIK